VPANDAQARALSPLKDDPKAVAQAWVAAQQRAREEGRPKVTAKVIEQVVEEVAEKRTASQPDRSKKAVEERRERIRQLAADGYSSRQAATELGMGFEGVRKIAREIGVTFLADQVAGRSQSHDADRIVSQIVIAAEGAAMSVALIDFDAIDESQVDGWLDSLTTALATLQGLKKRLKERA
jgi:hypothetical protein